MKQRILVVSLVITEFLMLFLMYKSSNNKLDNKDNLLVKNNTFAIMIDEGDGNGYQLDPDRNSIPDESEGYIFDRSRSGCLDRSGNKVTASITYNDGNITVSTASTAYCYLYFKIDNGTTGDNIIESTSNLSMTQIVTLNLEDEDGLKGYYFGLINPSTLEYKYAALSGSASQQITNIEVNEEGLYYLSVIDNNNTVTTITKNFWKTTFNMTQGTIIPEEVLTMDGNSFNLPTPTPDSGYSNDGYWYTNDACTEGASAYEQSYSPIENKTLYSIISTTPTELLLNDFINNNKVVHFTGLTPDDGWRFTNGNSTTEPNNFVCFGNTNCSSSTNKQFLYRIIGFFKDTSIDDDWHMKLVKVYTIGDKYWHTAYNVEWPDSNLCTQLNTATASSAQTGSSNYEKAAFYYNTYYIPTNDNGTNWRDKIIQWNWHYVTNTSFWDSYTATRVYNAEMAASTTSQYIGLIYVHDYLFSYGSNSLSQKNSNYYSTQKSGWNWFYKLETSNSYEWAISLYSARYPWMVANDGSAYGDVHSMSNAGVVRPVFFLKSSVSITGGEGTSGNPYKLS